MKRNLKRGQSILEYTLVLGAVIAVIILVMFRSGGIKANVGAVYDKAATAIGNAGTNMSTGVFGSIPSGGT